MQIHPLKIAIVQIVSGVFIIFLIFIGYAFISNWHAQSKAEAKCASISIGASASSVEQSLGPADTDKVDKYLRHSSTDFISVGYRGAFTDRWMCNAKIRNGKVTEKEVHLMD